MKEFLDKDLKLKINEKKTKITHVTKGVPFLGHIFSRAKLVVKQRFNNKLRNRRMTVPTLYADINKIIKRMSENKICDKKGNPLPMFRFLQYSQLETNTKINMILRGLCNWWSIANNRKPATARIAYILRYSVAKLYAAKFKLKTVAAVFKRGSNDLHRAIGNNKRSAIGITNNVKKIPGILYDRYWKIPKREGSKLLKNWKPEYLKALETGSVKDILKHISENKKENNLFNSLNWRLQKSIYHQGTACSVCGSFENVQMHHIKATKNYKSKNKLTNIINSINAEQIPLCHKHHLEIHKGNWNNLPMKPR